MHRLSRQITYTRYEFTAAQADEEDTVHTSDLLTFVYDIPYFGACGIFPPRHVANEMFQRGTIGGGMGPGTSWEPFTVSEDEYAALVEAIQETPVDTIKPHARYAFVKFKFDASLDGIDSWYAWVSACCKKHRESWHRELRNAGATS
ncbi:MAG TPA: hypothetical protein VMG82_30625 [Candidatus Sulfotelmatobacter sp.]|nr:hypothetical protein [Candidatus Sulfotelmatobacter sp.]